MAKKRSGKVKAKRKKPAPRGRRRDSKAEVRIEASSLIVRNLVRARSIASFSRRTKTIAAKEIVHRLEIYFQKAIRNPDAPIGNYVLGGALALRALPVDLNRTGLFANDGISFAAGAFDRVTKIKELGAIIVGGYIAAGWHVT